MTSMDTEDLIVTELESAMEIPCDYMDDPYGECPGTRAEWILHLVRCGCGQGGQALACDHCKELRMGSEGAVECSGCGDLTAPARLAYGYVEYLNRRPQ